jgi:hypothetical protein
MAAPKTFMKKLARRATVSALLCVSVAFGETPKEHTSVGSEASEPSQKEPSKDPRATRAPFRRHSIGSSLFMLYNLIPIEESPSFFQLNYNYRATEKDVFSLEAITWKYYAPLGIPWGPAMSAPENQYPGSARGFGLGAVYKRFIWKGAYAALHALPLRQIYRDEDNKVIQGGFQLFVTVRAGYHIPFFKERFFIEPSIAATSWPINTNLPASFAAKDEEWPKYFLAEPGLHFGVNL